jgi:hypothetical protein
MSTTAETEFSQRMRREGALGMLLCEHIWDKYDPLHLGGEDFEVIGSDEVPGYEDDDMAVLLRRKSDGQVFEAEIDVTMHPAREAARQEETVPVQEALL